MNTETEDQNPVEFEYLGEFTDIPKEDAEPKKSFLQRVGETVKFGGFLVLITVAGFGVSYPLFSFVFAQQ